MQPAAGPPGDRLGHAPGDDLVTMHGRALLESFDRSGFGVVLVDEVGQVLHRSESLERTLADPESHDLRTRLDEIADLVPQVGPGLRSEDGAVDLRASMSIRVGSDWYRIFVLELVPGLLAEGRRCSWR